MGCSSNRSMPKSRLEQNTCSLREDRSWFISLHNSTIWTTKSDRLNLICQRMLCRGVKRIEKSYGGVLANDLNGFPLFRTVTPKQQSHSDCPVGDHRDPYEEHIEREPRPCNDRNGQTDSPHTDRCREHDEAGIAGSS